MNEVRIQAGEEFRYWSTWLLVFVVLWGVGYFSLAPAPFELMQSNWPFILVGFAAAIVGNISAIGGGIIFIPAMIFCFQLPPVVALKVALASQCFGMTSGAVGWMQKKVVPFKALGMTVPGLLIGSTISSLLIHPSALLVKLFFGPVSILLGVLTLVLARKAAAGATLDIPDRAKLPMFVASVLGGLITGWVAIGEGELVAALLMLAYGLEASASIGLGVVLLAINSFYLTGIHCVALGGVPWDIVAFTGLGCVFGARLAPYVSKRFSATGLKMIFAAIAIADGFLFIAQYVFMH